MYVPLLGEISDLLLVLVLLLAAFYWYCQRITGVWESLGVPGPRPLPILYHMRELSKGPGAALDKWATLYGKTYGVYCFQTRGATLVTTDAELLNNILITDFASFQDREYLSTTVSTVCDGLFFQNGNTWRRNRRLMSPMFTGGKLRLMLNLVNTSAGNFAKFIRDRKEKGELLPVKQIAARYTSDVIAKTGFGVDVEALTREDSEFFHHIENFFVMGRPAFKFFYLLSVNYFPFLIRFASRFWGAVDPIVPAAENHFVGMTKSVMADKKKDKARKSRAIAKQEMDMLDLLLEAEVPDGRRLTADDNYLSMKDIIGNSSILILAGFETTSTLLHSLFYALARHPEVQERVIEEVDQVMAERAVPDYDMLKQMTYTQQVINETLRMFPPSPSIMRTCLATKTYGDVTIPKGSSVFIPIYKIHRDPEYWPNPNTFDPERFSAANKNSFPQAAFIPFGLGPRQCVAKRLALIEVKSALCHILSKMKFVLTEHTQPKASDEDIRQTLSFGFLMPDKPILLDVEYRAS